MKKQNKRYSKPRTNVQKKDPYKHIMERASDQRIEMISLQLLS